MTIKKAAVVGGGIIGRSWAVVYARAGVPVVVYDYLPEGRTAMPARFASMVLESAALCGDEAAQAATLARITVVDNSPRSSPRRILFTNASTRSLIANARSSSNSTG